MSLRRISLSHPVIPKTWIERKPHSASDARDMNVIPFATLFVVAAAETCIRFLKNSGERRIFHTIPGRIWRWNDFEEEFEEIHAVKLNGTAVCSVAMADDLRGRVIVAAVDTMHPYILRKPDNTAVTGFIGDIWTTLEEALQFKTIYRKAGPSASQTLMNGQAHALLLATVIYSDTSGYYTYSTPITSISYALFVQSDGTLVSQRWFANAFSGGLWLAVLGFLMVTTASILATRRFEKAIGTSSANDCEFSSVSFDLLLVLASLCGQGCDRVPTSWPLRLIILSHLATGLLLFSGFSSALTSFLATHQTSVPLTSLEDALQKRSHSVCVRNDSSAYIRFTVNGAPTGDVKEEWKNLLNIDCPDMRDAAALDSQLCRPGLAFLEVPDVFLPIYRRAWRDCSVVRTPNRYWGIRIAFLHSRFAEHRRVIDTYLIRLHSAGILKYLERKWMPKEMHGAKDEGSALGQVEYGHVHTLFLGLICAAIVSGFVCVLENIWYRSHVKRYCD